MGMCIQNEIVRDGAIPYCPRLAGIHVTRCVQNCRYCRGYSLQVSFMDEYQKGVGHSQKMESFSVVVCSYPHLNEFDLRRRKPVTSGGIPKKQTY